MSQTKMILYPEIAATVNWLPINEITTERKEILQSLVNYIREKSDSGQEINLNFICTHNSRRSQFSQVWGQVAADYYEMEISCFSGGVEVTAFNERAVQSLRDTGFKVEKEGTINPEYSLCYAENTPAIKTFSKMYDNQVNPASGFAAIMTCSHADKNCPFIAGAEKRIPIRYNDPKKYDGTPKEIARYRETSLEIATELFYVFSQVKNQ